MAADVKKIDFILPKANQNSHIADVTKQLANAFERYGVKTRIISPPQDKKPEDFINDLIENAPDCTVTVNGILPDREGHFLADMIHIPHVAILTDSPNIYLEMAKSSYTIVACLDAYFTEFFRRAGSKNALFLPFEAPIEEGDETSFDKRDIDILMPLELIDPAAISKEWEKQYPEKMVNVLSMAAENALTQADLSYYPAFLEQINQLSSQEREEFKKFHSIPLLHELEMFIRGTDQLELLRCLEGFNVHLLIQKGTKEKWGKLLSGFDETFQYQEGSGHKILHTLLSETKICLSSSPHIKRGTNGLVYTALQDGAYAISSQTPYLQESFSENEGVYYYPFKNAQKIRSKVEELLTNPERSQKAIEKGQQMVQKEHTWNNYAHALLEKLPQILATLPYGLQTPSEKT